MAYDIAVMVGVVGFAFIFAYISTHFDKDQFGASAFQILFLVCTLVLMLFGTVFMIDISASATETNLQNILSEGFLPFMLIIFFVFIMLIFISYLYSIMSAMKIKKEEYKHQKYLSNG
jgi:cytochrome bd-type quinol oxidase subunit 2